MVTKTRAGLRALQRQRFLFLVQGLVPFMMTYMVFQRRPLEAPTEFEI